MRQAFAFAVLLALAPGAGAQDRPTFDNPPPLALPDISDWEAHGSTLELEDPDRALDYELRVAPERQGVWAVTRYRTRYTDASAGPPGGEDERLQWNDGERFRRWVCRPRPPAACRWQELEEGTPEYQEELAAVLLVWQMHRRLLWARARSLLPHD